MRWACEKVRLALPHGRITTNDLRALVDATELAALDVRHLTSSPSCIASTFASARLGGLTLHSDNATFDLTCFGVSVCCVTPGFGVEALENRWPAWPGWRQSWVGS